MHSILKHLPNGNRFVRHAECIPPNAFLIPNIRETGTMPKRKERCTGLSWAVPIDNEHVTGLSIVAWPLENGEPKKGWRVQDIRPGSVLSRKYEDRQRKPDDLEAQEGQRTIALHALENLAPSDTGIALLRRTLREQIKRVSDGLDPMNVMRDERLNRTIPTNAWNTILPPTEESVLTENLTATIRKVRREQVQTSAELAYPAAGLLCRVGIGKRRDGHAVVKSRRMISAIDTK